jgi:eukaryotic-like serine/threonine-protein kinase
LALDLRDQLQTTLGSAYTLDRELGGGGMSRVFVAHETRLGRRVVVKVLSPELAAGMSTERFEREMRVAAQLQDPRIVPVLTSGETGGIPFYTMPFVDGESLRARLMRGRVPLAEAISLLRDIALALAHAHAHGIVHRDIKPENVLLSGTTAVVTDFGIAKAIETSTNASAGAALTNQGIALGTPAYMAPEQALGEATVDARADIYAWGVVAFETLSGQHPFGTRGSSQAMVAAHLGESPPPLATRASEVPAGLSALIDRSLQKDPGERPPNADELVRALDAAGHLSGVSAVPQRRTMSWALAAAVGIATIAAVMLTQRSRSTQVDDRSSSIRSLAVMPFIGESGDTNTAYLGNGLTDALTTTLATLPELRVVANQSAATAGRGMSASEAGRALGVDAVLEGAVYREQNRLRIRTLLTRVADGTVLWGDKYDHTSSNMFELEDDVTAAIMYELRGALTGERAVVASGVPRGTADPVAYDLYLRGKYAWAKRGERGLLNAVDLFKNAIRRDSTFARAHAGLAMAYVVLPVFTASLSVDSALALAARSANRALALDSSLADAHLALAYGLKMQWRWADAEPHFRAAVTLAPDDATVRHWYGVHLYARGDAKGSVSQMESARALDPFATTIAVDGAMALFAARRFRDARAEVRRAVVMDPTRSDSWFMQGLVQLADRDADSAIVSFEKARQLGTTFDMRPYVAAAHRASGRTVTADSIYANLQAAYRDGRATPFDIALAAANVGDRATVFSALQRVVDRRDLLVTEVSLPCEPLFDSVRSDPRFAALLTSAGMLTCGP